MCVALTFPFWPSSPTSFECFIICALLGLCYLQQRRVFYLGSLFGLIFFTYHTILWQSNSVLLEQSANWRVYGVIKDTRATPRGTELLVSVISPKELSKQTLQVIDSTPNVKYEHGQHWLLSVAMTPVLAPWHATNSYHRRLFGNNIRATGWVQSSLLKRHSLSFRGQLLSELRRLGVHSDSWLTALLLGVKPSSSELSTTLKNAGIIHLFVISGLHFAVVATGMYWLFVRILGVCNVGYNHRNRRVLLCILIVLTGYFYVDLVGEQAPAQRAFVAMCIGLFLRLFYVRVRYCDILLCVFLILVLNNPFCVVLASVYLTFGALLSIGLCAHWLVLSANTLWQKIQAFFVFQIVLTVLFTPVQFHILGYIHLLSWLWNLLFIPIVTLFYVPAGIVLLVFIYLNMISHLMMDPFVQDCVFLLDASLEWLIRLLDRVLTEPFTGSMSLYSLLCSWLLMIAGASLPVVYWQRCCAVVIGLGLLILGITL